MGTAPPASVTALRFDDLERAVRHLGEELAFFRRRALDAERRARELAAHPPAAHPPAAAPAVAASGAPAVVPAEVQARLEALEAENADLRERLREAADRTRAIADRVRFVRQQAGFEEEDAA